MSYDPSDERLESALNDIMAALGECPPRLKKMLLVRLFDKISLLRALLEREGLAADEEAIKKAREELWEKVEDSRLEEARNFLYVLMSQELP